MDWIPILLIAVVAVAMFGAGMVASLAQAKAKLQKTVVDFVDEHDIDLNPFDNPSEEVIVSSVDSVRIAFLTVSKYLADQGMTEETQAATNMSDIRASLANDLMPFAVPKSVIEIVPAKNKSTVNESDGA